MSTKPPRPVRVWPARIDADPLTITHGESASDGHTREGALGWQDDL